MRRSRRGWHGSAWSLRWLRAVALSTVLLLVLGVSTQSASAAQLGRGSLRVSGRAFVRAVEHTWLYREGDALVESVFDAKPVAPVQQRAIAARSVSTKAEAGSGHAPGVAPGQVAAAGHGLAKVAAGRSAVRQVGFNAKTSTMLGKKSTANETWYQNADGTQTERISQNAVNYKDSAGDWVPIDSTLTRATDGRYAQKANGFTLSVSGGAGQAASADDLDSWLVSSEHGTVRDADTTVSAGSSMGELAELGFGTSESFGWELSGANAVDASESSDDLTVSYPGILTDTTLELASQDSGVKESLVLSSADAPSSWTFNLDESGVTLEDSSTGGWELVDSSGNVVATLPAPYAYDAAGAQTNAVTYTLNTVNGAQELTMSLDSSWLAASSRSFPVTVDPSVSVSYAGSEDSATVEDSTSNTSASSTNYGTSDHLQVGLSSDSTSYYESYLNFPAAQVSDTGWHITAASLTAFMTSGSSSSSYPFTVYSAGASWSASTITYNNAPGYDFNLGSYDGDIGSTTTCAGTSGNWAATTLNAADMTNFAVNKYYWYGLILSADSTTSTSYYKEFDSDEVDSCSPYLYFTYTADVAPTLSTMDPASGTNLSTLTPNLTASGTDSDAWPNSSVSYYFKVYSTNNTSTPVASSAALSSGSWTVPTGALKWANTYEWDVCVYDGFECQGTSLTTYTFYTDAPGPVLSEDLSQDSDGHGFNVQNGDYSTSATDANVAGIGPALAVARDYNSLDDREDGGFGQSWSSEVDSTVSQVLDPTGAVAEAAVRYPDGELLSFGLDSNGDYVAPEGRYATLVPYACSSTIEGYQLTDKTDTTYTYCAEVTDPVTSDGASNVGGVYGLTQVEDRYQRVTQFIWNTYTESRTFDNATTTITFSRPGSETDLADGRSLYFTWSYPDNAQYPHVQYVNTSPATGSTASSEQEWEYGYTGDQLSTVCAPSVTASATPSSDCTRYTYNDGSVYQQAVLDSNAYEYWPLSDASTSDEDARSQSLVYANIGEGLASYNNLTPDTTGPTTKYSDSTAMGAVFQSADDSSVGLPSGLILNTTYVSVGLWFKTTTSGPLFCEQNATMLATPTAATCSLYVGTDGKLHGQWYTSTTSATIASSSTVTDGQWHYVVLSGNGNTQTMYLDGSQVGSPLSGTVSNLAQTYEYIGAGYSSGTWPDTPSAGNWYFNGSIADVAVYKQGVPAAEVSSLYDAATDSAASLTSIVRPNKAVISTEQDAADVSYNTLTGRVQSVTDGNGGAWGLSTPTATGSSQVFAETVMSDSPVDYYRFDDASGSSVATDAVNADAWDNPTLTATYSGVTLGTDGTAFGDGTDAASFNGTSSYVQVPGNLDLTAPVSVGLWFKTSASGPLYCTQSSTLPAAAADATCPLYVGTNGDLYGSFYLGATSGIVSKDKVNNGTWHYALITTTSTSESLYLDGALVGTQTGTFEANGQDVDYVGAGYSSGDWPNTATKSNWYFNGDISDAAFFRTALSSAQATSLWQGYNNTQGSVVPLESVTVTDPVNTATGAAATETYQFDPAHGGRLVRYVDGRGGATTYGYDANGFLYSTTDPNGDETITGNDARGNVVSTTTCQFQAADDCQTSYSSYYLDSSSETDPRNDLVTASRDGRSSSSTDATYETSYTYDGQGDQLTKTDPDGNVTTNTYTAASTTYACAYNSSTLGLLSTTLYEPAYLLATTTVPGGGITTYTYYADGDVCMVENAEGLQTFFDYDGLGRILTKTVTGSNEVSGTTQVFSEDLVTSYTYDGLGRAYKTVEPAVTDRVTGAVHTEEILATYDADGDVLTQTDEDTTGGDAPRVTQYTYNGEDQKQTEISPNGYESSDPAAYTTSYTYDAFGNVETETTPPTTSDPNGVTTEYLYDADNELVTTELLQTDANGTYDTSAKPLVTDSKQYDAGGRLAAETDAMSRTTCYLYYDDNLLYQKIVVDGTTCPTSTAPTTSTQFVETTDTYDGADDLLTTVTNGGETETVYTYDPDKRALTKILDPGSEDRVTTDTYFADGYLKEETVANAAGTVSDTDYTYDALGQMESKTVVDTYGGTTSDLITTYTLDERGLAVQIKDPLGNVTDNTYDEDGRLVVTQSPQVQSVTANASTGVVTTAPAYAITTTGYDTYGDVVETEAPDSPDAGSETTSATAASTVYAYDADGNKVSETLPSYTAPDASSPAASTATYTYNGADQLVSEADPIAVASAAASGDSTPTVGEVTTYSYNNAGDKTAEAVDDLTAGVTATTTNVYDADGEQTASTDPVGAVTQETYDYLGREATSTVEERFTSASSTGAAAVDYVTDYSYGAGGWLSEQKSTTTGDETLYAYYPDGQVLSKTDTTGDAVSYTYDGAGRVLKTTQANGTYSVVTYDEAGFKRVVETYSAAGAEVADSTYGYDEDGDLTESTTLQSSTANPATYYTYDATGLMLTETQQAGTASNTSSMEVEYGYDLDGNKTAITSGNGEGITPYSLTAAGTVASSAGGHTTYTTYNAWNLQESEIQPPANQGDSADDYTTLATEVTTDSYDADGDLLYESEPGGVSLTYTYDGRGDVLTQSGSGALATTATRTLTYDLDGRVLTSTTANTSTTGTSNAKNEVYQYDDRGLLLESSGAAGTSIFTYTADGQMATREDASGTSTYTYDSDDRLSTDQDAATGVTSTYGYNADDQLATITYGTGGDVQTYTYNGAGEVTVDELQTAAEAAADSSSVVKEITYAYDDAGDLIAKTDTAGGTNAYTYDEAGRLITWTLTPSGSTTATTTDYTYDRDSNRTQVGANVYTYNDRDELTGDGVKAYTYTANGDLEFTTQTGTSGTTQVSYTDDAFGQQLTAGGSSYVYDAAGRLVTQTTGATVTNLEYSGLGNDLASDGTDEYSRDPSGDLVGVYFTTSSTGRLLWTDLHTDVVGDFESTTSTMQGVQQYDPLGNVLDSTGSMPAVTVGYQSEWTDTSTGDLDMDARWYNPANGQFLNQDTVSNSATPNTANANPFAYADGNPLTNTDPSGHMISCGPGCGGVSIYYGMTEQQIKALIQRQDIVAEETAAQQEIQQLKQSEIQAQCAVACITAEKPQTPPSGMPEATSAAPTPPRVVPDPVAQVAAHRPPPETGSSLKAWLKGGALVLGFFAGDGLGDVIAEGLDGLLDLSDAVDGAADFGEDALDISSEEAETELAKAEAGFQKAIDFEKSEISADEAELADLDDPVDASPTPKTSSTPTTNTGGGSGDPTGDSGSAGQSSSAGDDTAASNGGTTPTDSGAAEKIGQKGLAVEPMDPASDVVAQAGPDAPPEAIADPSASPASAQTAAVAQDDAVTQDAAANADAGSDADGGQSDSCDTDDAPPHSFVGTTPVLLANGTRVPIDQIKVGDMIMNSVPGTSATQAHEVTAVITTYTDHDYVDVTVTPVTATTSKTSAVAAKAATALKKAATAVAAAALILTGVGTASAATTTTPTTSAQALGGGTLTTTYTHPFYDQTQQAFVQAQSLHVGDLLQTPTGQARITNLHLFHANTTTYDLTIGTLHTYYVIAGNTPVLVHNCNTNDSLADLPIHSDPENFYVKAGELVDNRIASHPLTEDQLYGGDTVEHDGVSNLTDEQLMMPGGPNGDDPISGYREFAPGDTTQYPGSEVHITGGHHRTFLIAQRVLSGDIDPETLIEFAIRR